MKRSIILSLLLTPLVINASTTNRQLQFANEKVTVWKTEVYPSSKQMLPMHRHDYDRVVVALTDGKLKITSDKGVVHYFTLVKNQPYYVPKDKPKEMHMDENISKNSVVVMVIELHQ